MKSFHSFLIEESKRKFSKDAAKRLGDSLSVNWDMVSVDQFVMGLSVEAEHDDGGDLDVVDSDKDLAKIVLAHLKEKPDYYTKLRSVEEEVPANSIGGNGVAGLKGEPIIRPKHRKKMLSR